MLGLNEGKEYTPRKRQELAYMFERVTELYKTHAEDPLGLTSKVV